MDFFQQQDIARRNTRFLVLAFIASVLILILLTNVLVAAIVSVNQDYNVYSGVRGGWSGFIAQFTWERFGSIALGVTAVVGLVVFFKWVQLATGGKAVAENMGGVRLLPQSRDRAERRVLNIVDEMALAANMPVPPVYVLNGERGINAFAAGISPADAVIAVTRGAVDNLKRHELQGVIAHEFSHILNGDMRLNIRLAAMLKGITFIGDIGHLLMRSGSNVRSGTSGRGAGPMMPVLGIALWLIGWLGGLAASMIKAAISRQKEYLADASAVQYTRSPEGIGDALKVIGGYLPGTLVHAARAAEMSHIFFGQIEHPLWHLFPTHPPLEQRIARVDPNWDGKFIERKPKVYTEEPVRPGHGEVGVGRAAIVAAAAAAALDDAAADSEFAGPDRLDEQTAEREEIPVGLVRHSHEPLGAQSLVFSLLLSEERAARELQMALISASGVRGLDDLVATLYPGVQALGAPRRLPLLELCLPALKAISAPQYRIFKNTLLELIRADQRTDLHEWCLFQLVRHYLDPEFVQVRHSRPRYRSLQKVDYHIRAVLSVLSYQGCGDPDDRFAAGARELGFNALRLMPREQASVGAFSAAVYELADCYPLLKPRLLKAMLKTATYDGDLNPVEKETIASIAAVMDCPVPDWHTL